MNISRTAAVQYDFHTLHVILHKSDYGMESLIDTT